jgi:CheY-like chemotaxis protein
LRSACRHDSVEPELPGGHGGEAAVEYLRANKADLIVLDMIMDPGIDGLETYRRILEIRPRQKAIIVSGFAKTDRGGTAQALGAGEYVKKPYVIEKLSRTSASSNSTGGPVSNIDNENLA